MKIPFDKSKKWLPRETKRDRITLHMWHKFLHIVCCLHTNTEGAAKGIRKVIEKVYRPESRPSVFISSI